VLLILPGASSYAQSPQPVSIAEAIRLGVAHSLTVNGATARVGGAQARLHGASVPANPVIFIGPHTGSELTGGTDEDILVTQTFELGDKRRQRIHSGRSELQAAQSDRADVTLDAVFAIRQAYVEAQRSDADYQLAADALKNAQTFEKAAETQLQAGDVARSNVVRSRVEVSRAMQALDAADTDRANRYATLRSLLGMTPNAPIQLTDSLDYHVLTAGEENLVRYALQHRPDLAALQRRTEARAADLHLAKVASQPDLAIEARKRLLDPNNGDASLHVGLQFPLFDYGGAKSNVDAARATLQDQTASFAEAKRTAELEVRTAFRTLQQDAKAVEAFRNGRLKDARDLLDMAELGYSHGANSYLELLDAQQVYRTEQTEYERALADYNIATATLERAVGGTLP
jgi:cobalt-zinc-cadmium efflux system outer membrane protein